MRNLRNLVAISATAAFVAIGGSVIAQDDLDDLLNDLASDATSAEESTAEEPTVEEPAEDEPSVEEPATVEESIEEEPTAEEEPSAEEDEPSVEEPAAEEESTEEEPTAEEEPTEEEPTEDEPVGEEPAVDNLEPEEPAGEAAGEPVDEPGDEPDGEAVDDEPDGTSEEGTAIVAGTDGGEPGEQPPQDNKDEELLDVIGEVARLRIEAYKQQATREIEEARKCLGNEDFLGMAKHYHTASRLLREVKVSDSVRKECEQGIAEGLYRASLQEYATGRRERAYKLMEKAINRRHPKARIQFEDWKAAGDPDANAKDITDIKHLRNDEAYKALRATNNLHLKRGRQYFAQRNLDKALEEVELVLVTDENNKEAISLRRQIERKRQTILKSEREAARDGMIADVDEAWRPVYAVDAREVEDVRGGRETVKKPIGGQDPERAQEQRIIKRMKEMRLPAISFKPPSTIIDAVEFFRQASKDFDDPSLPAEQRGFNFLLRLKEQINTTAATESDGGGFMDDSEDEGATVQSGVPQIPLFTVSDVSLYEALNLVCSQVGYKFKVKGGIVIVMHKDMSIDEMITRSYPVLSSFMERMNTASDEMKEMKSQGFGSNNARASDEGEENQERDWKAFFELLGVKWPEGSSIMYIKTIGKLRVRNTYDNLAELEQALTEMNADPKLIEIETRFVEVCQEDLNSLGFEWILNSDYSLNLGAHASRMLGLRRGMFGERTGPTTTTKYDSSDVYSYSGARAGTGNVAGGNGLGIDGGIGTVSGSTASGNTTVGETWSGSRSTSTSGSIARYAYSHGANWVRDPSGRSHHNRNVGVSSTYDADGNAVFGQGNRYLSTLSNHISGEGRAINDQFMKVNAFLGAADLSMILHMLSQRSDTDLLSAPKVLTQSGEEAVMKVVTEFIYPTDYDVQLTTGGGGGNRNGGGGNSTALAIVEPQQFTMREVGVILTTTPTLTDDGNLIDLELDAKIVDEPTWKNYGMKIPFTGNASMLENFDGIGDILTGLSDVLGTLGTGLSDTMRATFAETAVNSATTALDSLTSTTSDSNITYYDAPMEQPFFHMRQVSSKISVYPGATVVMGGLITEQRKAMDDKVPFLGDIPLIGRLFRSHSEQTRKRNLLIFVTTRLVDTRGRELRARDIQEDRPDEVLSATAPTPES